MKEFYLSRIKESWTLSEIDDTDFFYFLDLIAYDADKNKVTCTMDEIF
jgi:hypothetical protein